MDNPLPVTFETHSSLSCAILPTSKRKIITHRSIVSRANLYVPTVSSKFAKASMSTPGSESRSAYYTSEAQALSRHGDQEALSREETTETRPMTKIEKQEAILNKFPPPEHWCAPQTSESFGKLHWAIFNVLCITSFGHPGLEPVWAAIRLEENGDGSVWEDAIQQTCDRLNNMLLVVRPHPCPLTALTPTDVLTGWVASRYRCRTLDDTTS